MRFIAIPNYTPHRIAFGLTPSALRLPLKGGVVFLSRRAVTYDKSRNQGFFNNPGKGGGHTGPPLQNYRVLTRRGGPECLPGLETGFFHPPPQGLLKKSLLGRIADWRVGAAYHAALPFRLHNAGRIYATPTNKFSLSGFFHPPPQGSFLLSPSSGRLFEQPLSPGTCR